MGLHSLQWGVFQFNQVDLTREEQLGSIILEP